MLPLGYPEATLRLPQGREPPRWTETAPKREFGSWNACLSVFICVHLWFSAAQKRLITAETALLLRPVALYCSF